MGILTEDDSAEEEGEDAFDPMGHPVWQSDSPPKYGKQALKYYRTILAPLFFDAAKADQDYLFQAAQAMQGDIFDVFGEGFGNARANIAEQGRLGEQQIGDALTQALAASGQASVDSGLSGGTGHLTANRGIAADAARNISGLRANLGQLYSGLDIGEAQAKAGALGGMSGLFQNQAQAGQNFLGLQLGGIGQTPIKPDKESGLMGLAGSFLGAAGAADGFAGLFAGL